MTGGLKAAYGTFLTVLLVEYCHDQVADEAASIYNVTWSRTSPIIVSAGDDAYQTYVTLECDEGMGMTAVGTPQDIRAFNYACSSAISSIEYNVMNDLGFNYQSNSTFTGDIGSVMVDLGSEFLNGILPDMFEQNGFTVIEGNNSSIMVIDPETGIVRDINLVNGYSGAYCYSNYQTNLAGNLGTALQKNLMPWFGLIGEASVSGASVFIAEGSTSELAVVLGSNPIGWVVGLAGIFGAVDGYLTLMYPDEAVPANLEAMPGIGTLLTVYDLQSEIQGNGNPLTPGNLGNDCQEGSNVLLALSEDDDFDNAVNELEELYVSKKYNPNDAYRSKEAEIANNDIRTKNAELKKLGGNGDDPDKWRKMLNEAVKNKKWVAATLIVGAGILDAFSSFLNGLENHK